MTSYSHTWPVLTSTHDGSEKCIVKGQIVHLSTVEVQKPYPNEHAARQTDPGKYDTFRRGKLPGASAGIFVIYGIRNVGGKRVSEIQSLRFDAKKWTPEAAKEWLKDHGFKTGGFEKAIGKPKGVKKMNTPEPRKQDVLVHKAVVPLMEGESMGVFTKALGAAGRDYLMQKYNIDSKKGSAWPVEVYANKAVFMVVPDYNQPSSNDFYVAVKFNRANTGQFNFVDTIKVTPVTTFVARNDEAVAKAAKTYGLDAWTKAESDFAGVL
jgi:hypothetical protein